MAPSAPPADRRRLLHSPLPGGVDAVRLPGVIADEVLDEALASGAAWLLLDATGSGDGAETVAVRVVRALERSFRPPGRTCLVCRRRPSLVAIDLATFTTVEDACQARLLADAGFGAGWAPVPLVGHPSRGLVAL